MSIKQETQTKAQESQGKTIEKTYCPFRSEGARCSSFCELNFFGSCSFKIMAHYFALMHNQVINQLQTMQTDLDDFIYNDSDSGEGVAK